jgi:hypothetical protein
MFQFLFVCGTHCPISPDLEDARNRDFPQCYLPGPNGTYLAENP